MTEKEFRKLRRDDLLELLLEESRENTSLKKQLISLDDKYKVLLRENLRLKKLSEEKDAEIQRLLSRITEKEASLEELRGQYEGLRASEDRRIEDAVEKITEVSTLLRDVFETAQKAADLYLEEIMELRGHTDNIS